MARESTCRACGKERSHVYVLLPRSCRPVGEREKERDRPETHKKRKRKRRRRQAAAAASAEAAERQQEEALGTQTHFTVITAFLAEATREEAAAAAERTAVAAEAHHRRAAIPRIRLCTPGCTMYFVLSGRESRETERERADGSPRECACYVLSALFLPFGKSKKKSAEEQSRKKRSKIAGAEEKEASRASKREDNVVFESCQGRSGSRSEAKRRLVISEPSEEEKALKKEGERERDENESPRHTKKRRKLDLLGSVVLSLSLSLSLCLGFIARGKTLKIHATAASLLFLAYTAAAAAAAKGGADSRERVSCRRRRRSVIMLNADSESQPRASQPSQAPLGRADPFMAFQTSANASISANHGDDARAREMEEEERTADT